MSNRSTLGGTEDMKKKHRLKPYSCSLRLVSDYHSNQLSFGDFSGEYFTEFMGDVSICNRIFQQKGKQNLWALWFFVFFFSFPLLGKEAIGQETLICSLLLEQKKC